MKFNTSRYLSTKYQPRTAEVEVPELREMFDDLEDGEKPVFIVRSLTRTDFIKMQDVINRNSNIAAVIEAIGSGGSSEPLLEQLKANLGVGDDVPEGAARELVMLEAGMQDPEFTTELAVKLYETHAMVVTRLINEISRLTNAGWEPGKPSGSTGTVLSATG